MDRGGYVQDLDDKDLEHTTLYSLDDLEESLVGSTLKDVCSALKEKGYNEINQLIGYIMSGDPGYISSYKDARNKITRIERSKIIEVILKEYVKNL